MERDYTSDEGRKINYQHHIIRFHCTQVVDQKFRKKGEDSSSSSNHPDLDGKSYSEQKVK